MVDILDSSWIANILSISFSMVIFLLGIPVLFIQTYVPEDLRKYYYQIGLKDAKFLRFYAVLLLLAILFFGNHGFKVFLLSKFADNTTYYLLGRIKFQVTTELLSISLYVLSLLFFTYTSTKIYRRFVRSAFRKENIKAEILAHFFEELATFQDLQSVPKEKWEDLIELSIIFDDVIGRSYFLHSFYKYILSILYHTDYSGRELKFFFENILYPMFVKRFDQVAYKELDSIIELCRVIIFHNKKMMDSANYDFQYICDVFVFGIYINLMKNDDISYAKKCIRLLRSAGVSDLTFFKINFFAFDCGIYAIPMEEIKNISISIDREGALSESRTHNLIAYLSFFYNDNLASRQYVYEYLKSFSFCNFTIDRRKLDEAEVYFYRMSKIETAGKIAKLGQDLEEIHNIIDTWNESNFMIIREVW